MVEMDYSYGSQFFNELFDDVLDLILHSDIENLDDSTFNNLSLRMFTFQFHNNAFYRKYCTDLDITPGDIDDFTRIPVVPTDFFKKYVLISFPESLLNSASFFTTSGTEFGVYGKIWRDPKTMELYDASYFRATKEYFFPDLEEGERMRMHFLASDPKDVPNSNMGHNTYLSEKFFGYGSKHFIDKEGFHVSDLSELLRQSEKTGEPVALKASTFSLILFLDYCQEGRLRFDLPEGSRCGYGGGSKGISRQASKEELIDLQDEVLDIQKSHANDLLAYSEHPTVFHENALRNNYLGVEEQRYKLDLPWTRTVVVPPETYENPKNMEVLPRGEEGYLCHFDFTSIGVVFGIITNDIGARLGKGFEILGRERPFKIPTQLRLI